MKNAKSQAIRNCFSIYQSQNKYVDNVETAESSYREGQSQAAECKLLDVGLGDGAASVYLVAGIILWVRVQN